MSDTKQWEIATRNFSGSYGPIVDGPDTDEKRVVVVEKSAYDEVKKDFDECWENYQDLGKLHDEAMSKVEAESEESNAQIVRREFDLGTLRAEAELLQEEIRKSAWAHDERAVAMRETGRVVRSLYEPIVKELREYSKKLWLSPDDGVRPIETAQFIDRILKPLGKT